MDFSSKISTNVLYCLVLYCLVLPVWRQFLPFKTGICCDDEEMYFDLSVKKKNVLKSGFHTKKEEKEIYVLFFSDLPEHRCLPE